MALVQNELMRYHRQMLIPGWGRPGQERLAAATVFVAGAGGLGSPVAIYLAAAGVGRLRICDDGSPEISNLNRQILFTEVDIGRQKALAAREALGAVNPHVIVEPLPERITPASAASLVAGSDIILDCLDNFETRHVLNRLAVARHLPMIHAGIYGLSGQMTFLHSPETPCLACVFPGSVPAQVFPVVGATPGVIGTLQAAEAIKWITGIGSNLKGRLLIWDGEEMLFQEVPIKRDPRCPVCGEGREE
jgi:adenylyltransferase/sulfurtransferase